jgi:hypothetical protein
VPAGLTNSLPDQERMALLLCIVRAAPAGLQVSTMQQMLSICCYKLKSKSCLDMDQSSVVAKDDFAGCFSVWLPPHPARSW